jgi:hypothetical protein
MIKSKKEIAALNPVAASLSVHTYYSIQAGIREKIIMINMVTAFSFITFYSCKFYLR